MSERSSNPTDSKSDSTDLPNDLQLTDGPPAAGWSVAVAGNESIFERHVRFGWLSLFCFALLGVFLEVLWAMRIEWYLNESLNLRRLLFRLAHAHGTLFSLIHIAFGFTVRAFPATTDGVKRFSSPCLLAASVLMPGGFFLGGIFLYGKGGDPGLGIFLVPVGALFLIVALFLTATGCKGSR